MKDQHTVQKDILVSASPQDVWTALTDPRITKEYFFHCEVSSDWEIGSAISFKGRIFLIRKIELTGTILDIEPLQMLKYTLHNDDDYREPSFSTITITLHPIGADTRLAITDDVGSGPGSEDRYERSEKGWEKILKGLKQVVEEKLTVDEP